MHTVHRVTPVMAKHTNSSVPTHIFTISTPLSGQKYMLSASYYLFSFRKVRSPEDINKFREDARFHPVERSGIPSEKVFFS